MMYFTSYLSKSQIPLAVTNNGSFRPMFDDVCTLSSQLKQCFGFVLDPQQEM